jgi:hypothetical protein
MRFPGRRGIVLIASLVAVLLFVKGVSKFWNRDTGFTAMIRFGSKFEPRCLDALKKVPRQTLPDSHGYDGQFHAQIALSPSLADPQLPSAIDNLAYRARRILFSWTAWLLGLGQPAWIIHAYSIQNVLAGLAMAVLLWHWLPPTSGFNFLRWAAVLFSSGMLTSVSHALLDGPALLLLLASIWLAERGRHAWAAALLGISALGKETNLLAAVALVPWPLDNRRQALRLLGGLLVLLAPIVLWLTYIRLFFDTSHWSGVRNFAIPFSGWIDKFEELSRDVRRDGWYPFHWITALCVFSFGVQCVYFLSRWQTSSAWWRIGVMYVLLGLCLGMAVLEGFPGAYTRALLPLQAAFNLSLRPTRSGWLWLALGNFGVFHGLETLRLLPL